MQHWPAKVVSMMMLMWASVSSANLPPAAVAGLDEDVQKILAWTSYLNTQYPTLNLEVVVVLDQEQNSRAVLREINQLKDVLQGTRSFPAKSFKALACTRPEC
jgi:hypothetical protein